jgi:chitin disaccharide deacetylase
MCYPELPGIRRQLLGALQDRRLGGRVWLRDPSDRGVAILSRRVAATKALMVKAMATGFAITARRAGFSLNEGFSGFSLFDAARDPAADFCRFFEQLGPRPVVMCHPGHVDAELRTLDPVLEPREREHAFLMSGRFGDLLETSRVTLVARPG